MRKLLVGGYALGMALATSLFGPTAAAEPIAEPLPPTTCLVPAQPEGGFDITCRMVSALLDGSTTAPPVKTEFVPGGVGAVAFNRAVVQNRSAPGTLIAFSEGSIYNLALGRYGDRSLGDVRWLAQVALDYGAVVVREDAPWADLQAFLTDVRAAPHRIALGGGGTLLGQDWMRAMMIATEAGIDYRAVRFVAFEGSGSCAQALMGGFVQACMNDVADTRTAMDAGRPLRLLAVLAPARLGGDLADIPTAREQGIALDWPVMRGVYMGPDVDDTVFSAWQTLLNARMATPDYLRVVQSYHLQPAPLTGAALEHDIAQMAQTARDRAARFGIP